MARVELRVSENTEGYAATPPVLSYVVTATVEIADGIPPELFVFRVDTGAFSHVATVRDLLGTGTSELQAEGEPSAPFYRRSEVKRTFDNKGLAIEFSRAMRTRIAMVVRDWTDDAARPFGGSDVVVLSGS